jgi:ParB family chromosome partitioning protein
MSDGLYALARIDSAKQALAEARDLTDILKVRDQAVAAQAYATARGADEAAQMAVEIKLRSERKAGQFLADMKEQDLLSKGGRPTETKDIMSPVLPTLRELGVEPQESKRWQKIAAIPEETFESRIVNAKKRTQKMLLETAHIGQCTGEVEWYTPQDYVKAARLTMGSIDVDPASCEKANQTVKASKYYTIDDDGLVQRWEGNVWMNPPYSQPLVAEFCNLLVDKFRKGETKQACVLVNNTTETQHYQNMLNYSQAVCFVKGRIKFIDKYGDAPSTPLQGQTVLYFGDSPRVFAENFSYFGGILFAD